VFVAAARLGEPVAADRIEFGGGGVLRMTAAQYGPQAAEDNRAEDQDRESEHTPPPEWMVALLSARWIPREIDENREAADAGPAACRISCR
jgi:hypothetical protein